MPQAIRVLHVIDSLAPGGAERVVVELANYLASAAAGDAVSPAVCVTRGDGSNKDETLESSINAGIAVHHLNRCGTWDRGGFKRLGNIVRRDKIDVVHSHGYSSTRFVVAAKAWNRLRTPLILHAHDYQPPNRASRLIGRRGIAHFIGVAPQQIAWAQALLGFTPSQTTLLGNAIDPTPYAGALPVDLNSYFATRPRFVGLAIANVRPVKQFETLLRAVAQSEFRADIGILIAGSLENTVYVAQCRALTAELGLDNSVVFLGSRGDLPQLLAAADFGALSSADETGPMALLEFMAASRSFVATRVGQIGETVAGMRDFAPAFAPPGDAQAFAAALDELLRLTDAARDVRGHGGHLLMRRNFSLEQRVGVLRELYSRLVVN